MSLWLCEGWCRWFGPVRDMVRASGPLEAKAIFYSKHKLNATHVALER